jgi:hypothetical protein
MLMKTLSGLLSFPRAEEEEDQHEDAQNGGSDRHGVEHGDHR